MNVERYMLAIAESASPGALLQELGMLLREHAEQRQWYWPRTFAHEPSGDGPSRARSAVVQALALFKRSPNDYLAALRVRIACADYESAQGRSADRRQARIISKTAPAPDTDSFHLNHAPVDAVKALSRGSAQMAGRADRAREISHECAMVCVSIARIYGKPKTRREFAKVLEDAETVSLSILRYLPPNDPFGSPYQVDHAVRMILAGRSQELYRYDENRHAAGSC